MTPAERAAKFADCVRLLEGLYRPMTPQELAEFEQLKAREMARAEARRKPSPQTGLDV